MDSCLCNNRTLFGLQQVIFIWIAMCSVLLLVVLRYSVCSELLWSSSSTLSFLVAPSKSAPLQLIFQPHMLSPSSLPPQIRLTSLLGRQYAGKEDFCMVVPAYSRDGAWSSAYLFSLSCLAKSWNARCCWRLASMGGSAILKKLKSLFPGLWNRRRKTKSSEQTVKLPEG